MNKVDDNQEILSASEKLLDYQSQGYLFHGSPNMNIEILEPRKSKEVDPRKEFNIDTAVFASSSALLTIIFGAVPERNRLPEEIRAKTWHTDWPDGKISSRIPKEWKEFVMKNIGYVYILPKDTFTENKGLQYKSKLAVKPIDKIPVTLSDFIEMGGKVEWI